jgi:hypothetical protein
MLVTRNVYWLSLFEKGIAMRDDLNVLYEATAVIPEVSTCALVLHSLRFIHFKTECVLIQQCDCY